MKALKIIGTLAAIGGLYFLFSSDDEEKKEEESQENATPNTNISPTEQSPANIAASKINQADMQPTNPIDQLPAKASSFVMTPINDEFFTSIVKELPSDPEAQSPSTTIRPTSQLSTEFKPFALAPENYNPPIVYAIDPMDTSKRLFIQGNSEYKRFDAIEKKKENQMVPITIYSLIDIPESGSHLLILFPETKELMWFEDFLPQQAERLVAKKASLYVSFSIPNASRSILETIYSFVDVLNSYGVKTQWGSRRYNLYLE